MLTRVGEDDLVKKLPERDEKDEANADDDIDDEQNLPVGDVDL